MSIRDQFDIIQNIQTSSISQTSFLVGTFFAVSYNKTALASFICKSRGSFIRNVDKREGEKTADNWDGDVKNQK